MQMPYFCQLWTNASSTCIFHILKMIPNKQLYLVFLSMALEDACRPVIASCFSFYGTWRCLLPGDCILFFFLWHLKMLAAWWLHLVFLSMTLEDACYPVIASCFSFYGTWGCLQPGDCILFFFLEHLRMLAAWLVYLVFLSMALEDACSPVIASCFSFYGTWGCLPPDDCILLFLSMALEDACRPVIASCFSFYGTWGCLQTGDCILFFFLWHLKMLAAWWLHLAFLSMALEDACSPVIASCFFFLWHLRMLAAW